MATHKLVCEASGAHQEWDGDADDESKLRGYAREQGWKDSECVFKRK